MRMTVAGHGKRAMRAARCTPGKYNIKYNINSCALHSWSAARPIITTLYTLYHCVHFTWYTLFYYVEYPEERRDDLSVLPQVLFRILYRV